MQGQRANHGRGWAVNGQRAIIRLRYQVEITCAVRGLKTAVNGQRAIIRLQCKVDIMCAVRGLSLDFGIKQISRARSEG